MKNKFTRLIPLLLVSLVVIFAISCKKKNVTKIAVDNQFAISIFADSMSMMDVLGMMDSTTASWLRVKEDGTIVAFYDNKMDSVVMASDILDDVEDMDIPTTTTSFDLPPLGGKGIADTVPVDNFAAFPVSFPGFEITDAEFRKGWLVFSVELNEQLDMLKKIIVTTNSLKKDGQSLSLPMQVKGTLAKDSISLADYTLIPESAYMMFFSAALVLDIDPATYTAGTYDCTFEGGINDVGFKNVNGVIYQTLGKNFEQNLEINFGVNGIDGDLFLPVPKVSLIYRNTFGFGTECDVTKLRLVKTDGTYANLLGENDSVVVVVNPTGGDTVYQRIEGFAQQVNIMEHYKTFEFNGNVGIVFGEQGQVSVADTARIDVIGNIEMPLAMKISDLKYCDTVDVNFDSDIPDNNYFSEIDFFIDADSKIKLDLDLQVLFLNKNDVVVDSLFDGQHTINYNEPSTLQTIITNERIARVMSAKKLVIKIALSTDEISQDPVEFNVADRLALRMRMLTKSDEISLE